MLKMIGIMCVCSACAGMGFLKSYQLSRRMKELKQLYRIFLLIKGKIDFGGETLPEALTDISQRTIEPFAEFLEQVAKRLNSYSGNTFAHVFAACIDEELKGCCLTDGDKKELTEAGEMLGYLDRSMQLQAIETYLKSLELTMQDLHGVLPEQKKLYQSLGIMGGLMLGILLI